MKTQFYKKTWFIVLMLFILAPIGIFLMFKYTAWNKKFKIVASIVSGILFLIILFMPTDNSGDTTNNQKVLDKATATLTTTENTSTTTKEYTPTPGPVELVSYEIVQKGDVSFSNVKRYDWFVVVKEPATKEQLKDLARYITEQAKSSIEFNALSIGFYDYEEYIGNSPYVLGNVIFAPKGDWSLADSVNTGDYDSMSYNMVGLKEKDWSLQLTQEEVDVYRVWTELYDEKEELIDKNSDKLVDESEVDEETAEQLGMSVEEVSDIIWKQVLWSIDDAS